MYASQVAANKNITIIVGTNKKFDKCGGNFILIHPQYTHILFQAHLVSLVLV